MVTAIIYCLIFFYVTGWWKLRRKLTRFKKAKENMSFFEFIIFIVMNFIALMMIGSFATYILIMNVFENIDAEKENIYSWAVGITIALLRTIQHIKTYKNAPINNNIKNSTIIEVDEVDLNEKK